MLSVLEADSNSQSDIGGTAESERFRAELAESRIAEWSMSDGCSTGKKCSANALVMMEGSVVAAPLTVSSEGTGMDFDFPEKEARILNVSPGDARARKSAHALLLAGRRAR